MSETLLCPACRQTLQVPTELVAFTRAVLETARNEHTTVCPLFWELQGIIDDVCDALEEGSP